MGSGILPIDLERVDGRFHGRLKQAPMRMLPPPADMSAIATAFGLAMADVVDSPTARPVSTGAAHLLVHLHDRAAVDRASPQHERLAALLSQAGAEGCYIYALGEPPIERAYARAFSPTIGLWEDSATGTAPGPLAAYLAREGLLRGDALTIEQGVKMGRRSLLKITLEPDPVLSGAGISRCWACFESEAVRARVRLGAGHESLDDGRGPGSSRLWLGRYGRARSSRRRISATFLPSAHTIARVRR